MRGKASDALSVEGIEDENGDGEIEKSEDGGCVDRQPPRPRVAFRVAGHDRRMHDFRLDNDSDTRSLGSASPSLREREAPVGMTMFN